MAEPAVETFDAWVYVPHEEGFIPPGAPLDSAISIEHLSEGYVRQRGNVLYHYRTNRILGRVAPTSGSILERGSRGTLLLSNRTSLRNAIDRSSARSLPRVLLQGELEMADGALVEPVQRIISLAGRNKVIYVDESIPRGRGRYHSFERGIFGPAGPPQVNEFGRLATAEDLMVRAVARWLAINAPSIIERGKLAGVARGDGTVTTDASEIVRSLAARLSVVPLITYFLREAPA